MEIIKAVLFGIVEGITEWLPVSSTGHMILLDEFIQLKGNEEFINVFLVVIQLGAIFAVVLQFWNQLFPFQWKDSVFEELFYHAVPVAVALIVFGIAFIIIERWNKGRKPKIRTVDDLTVSAVLIIGVFQLLAAVFPGTSRSGATIVGALLIGVSRKAASEFTFFLAVPVMLGASLLKVLKYGFAFSGSELLVLGVGMVTAFFVSIVVIRFLMDYIKKHDFQAFGWYRIALGIVVLIGSMVGLVQV